MSTFSVLFVRIINSNDNIASKPQTKLLDVSFVVVRVVVWYAYKTIYSSSTHHPLASFSIVTKSCMIVLLVTSVCLFAFGCAIEVNLWFIWSYSHNFPKGLFANCSPLSEISVCGSLKWQMSCFQKNLIILWPVIVDNGSASTHLVK